MPVGETATLSPLAERLAAALEAAGRRRVEIEQVWRCFHDAEPALVTSAAKRARLAAALAELAGAGRAAPSRSHDHGVPPLPRFVQVPSRAPRIAARAPAASYPWRPELAWAAGLRLAPERFAALRAVNAFLRDGGAARPSVPARERSLQLWGDEKALEALARTSLFGPGRLTWELLRCRPVHPPFVWRETGPGPVLLVVENHHTYASLGEALPRGGPVGFLAYGAGNHFVASVASAADLPRRPGRILYFGDLDRRGLDIPIAASAVAARLGLPPVEPAAALYHLLLEVGRPRPGDAPLGSEAARRRASWLPAGVRGPAAALLERGERLAQEWVGLEVLLTRPVALSAQ